MRTAQKVQAWQTAFTCCSLVCMCLREKAREVLAVNCVASRSVLNQARALGSHCEQRSLLRRFAALGIAIYGDGWEQLHKTVTPSLHSGQPLTTVVPSKHTQSFYSHVAITCVQTCV